MQLQTELFHVPCLPWNMTFLLTLLTKHHLFLVGLAAVFLLFSFEWKQKLNPLWKWVKPIMFKKMRHTVPELCSVDTRISNIWNLILRIGKLDGDAVSPRECIKRYICNACSGYLILNHSALVSFFSTFTFQ